MDLTSEQESRLHALIAVLATQLPEVRAAAVNQMMEEREDRVVLETLCNHFGLPFPCETTISQLAKETSEPAPPQFQTEAELTQFLRDWARDQWRRSTDTEGTGRSGNAVSPILWQGAERLLKISHDHELLAREARHLRDLAGLRIGRCLAEVSAMVNGFRWRAYVMEKVGETSLRDYLFSQTPLPEPYLRRLCQDLASFYRRHHRPRPPETRFVAECLKELRDFLASVSHQANFSHLWSRLDQELLIHGQAPKATYRGPMAVLDEWLAPANLSNGRLAALEPAVVCEVHGDLHFENIRIDPREPERGDYWLIDPKPFFEGDYAYDLAKLLSSLTGHAHVDRGRDTGKAQEIVLPEPTPGAIQFNCWHSKVQAGAFKTCLGIVEELANELAPELEGKDGAEPSVTRLKKRLLLALARHFFSAAFYFDRRGDQLVLFARGTMFLNFFDRAVKGAAANEWNVFQVCQREDWLEVA
jgi:streptomycin 6-kinase